MPELTQLADDLASAVLSAEPTDLPGLARLHELFAEISDSAQGAHETVRGLGQSAGQLVERIILGEEADATAALDRVVQSVTDIQRLLEQAGAPASAAAESAGAVRAAEAPTPVAVPRPVSPPHAEVPAIAAESVVTQGDVALVKEFIGESIGHLESAEAELLKLEQDSRDPGAVNAVFRSFHTIKGVAGFLNLKQIGALAHVAENLLDLARQGRIEIAGPVANVVLEAADTLKLLVVSLDDAMTRNVPPPLHVPLPALLARLKAAAESRGTAIVETKTIEAPVEKAAVAERRQTERRQSDQPASDTGRAPSGDGAIKVSTERLDGMINMVGELVIAQSMVSQQIGSSGSCDQRLQRNLAHVSKIIRELQDLSMSMRMVPINCVFQKMNRLVRDVAQKAGKKVDLHIVGGETELDRNIVEAISDPLVHMVRNSVDHAIETPEGREKAGKPTAGVVELKASHKAGNIVIEIKDDGRGLNKQRILKKAIESGIVREGQELSEQEIFKLIFAAGLSTAEKVTDISGRGVGMDVVRRNIEALRGRIDIASVEGQGATFTIRLPLTLAVIDGMLVRVGSERYVIPITSIERSLRPTREQLSTVQNRGEMCLVRGALLPIYRLHRLFGLKPTAEDPTDALVVIVRDDDRLCCLLVDELLGQQQVVIKSLGDGVGPVRGVSGGAILGDGNVSLILDVPGIVSLAVGS